MGEPAGRTQSSARLVTRRTALGLALATVAGLLISAPTSLAQTTAVDAGGLRAEVSGDPWRLSLVGPQGGPVLVEHPGVGPGPTGSLPFTGLGLGVLVLAALALLGSGLVLRGRTRTRRATHRR